MRPNTDITITDCIFHNGHGLSVGSEVSGGVQHLRVERVTFKGTTQGIRIKSGRDRGNDIGDFVYKDITMEDVQTPIQITMYYGGGKAGEGADLLSSFSKLGFKPEQIEAFLPKALELIKSHLSPELLQKILTALPLLAKFLSSGAKQEA